MPGIVGAFLAVADAVTQVAVAGQLAAVTLRAAADEAKNYTAAVDEAKHVTAGIANAEPSSPGSLATALQAQTGRR